MKTLSLGLALFFAALVCLLVSYLLAPIPSKSLCDIPDSELGILTKNELVYIATMCKDR